MAKNSILTLRIIGPDGSINETRSEQESIILGSGAGAGVRLSDPRVSNLHVLLKREADGRVMAIDLGSEHGTRLGDAQALTDPTSLTDGDELQLGESRVRVLFGVAAVARAVAEAVRDAPSASAEVIHPPAAATAAAVALVPGAGASRVQARTGTPASADPAGDLLRAPLAGGAEPTSADRVLEVSLFWGDTLIDVRQFREGRGATVGSGRGAAFTIHGAGECATLATLAGSETTLLPPDGARVRLLRHGREEDAPAGPVGLGLLDRARVDLGALTFVLRHVRPARRIVGATFPEADYTFFKVVAVAFMALIAVLTALRLTPRVDRGLGDDLFANPARYTRMLVRPAKKIELVQLAPKGGQEEGAKAAGEEGRFGREDAPQKEAAPSRAGAPIVDKDKKEADRKKVMRSGLLGALGGGAVSDVLGPGGLGTGINSALGGLKSGAGLGDAQGVGGLGARGGGTGGGGTGLGLGGLGTQGTGRGGPGGAGGLELGGRGKEITRIVPGKTTAVGGLDKDVIEAVIRRHANEIKFCYEKELQKDPSLGGKVTVAWTIDPSGSVAEAMVQESSLANTAVEGCILSRIRRWRFPEEKNGSATQVTFPWVFKAAGGS